jgi:hypothetical protein
MNSKLDTAVPLGSSDQRKHAEPQGRETPDVTMLTLERKIGALVAARRGSGEMVVARYQRRMSSLSAG